MTERDDDRLWRRLRRVFRLPFNRSRVDAEIDEELRFHLDGRVEELMAAERLPRDAAERQARLRFGDFMRYRREAGDIDITTQHRRARMEIKDALVRETRHALRALLRAPSFSLISLLTLALGLGAATAIFTLLDAVVLRPLPYRNADRLVRLTSPVPLMKGQTEWGLGRHEMFYFLERGHTLDNMGVYQVSDVTVLGSGPAERPERVRWAQTSASLFVVLGFTPSHGRLFVAQDNHDQTPRSVVLGHGYWERRYGGDTSVVGRTISVEGSPLTVVGILRKGADLPDIKVDMWAPAWVDSTTVWNNHTWRAIARLNSGFSARDAERELAPLTEKLPEAFPNVYGSNFVKNTGFRTKVVSLREAVVGEMLTRALWTLFAAVGLVLLIAAANVANLFLVRLDARRREVAMRTALGADRRHLAWYYLTESLMLAVAAGICAVGISQVTLRALLTLAPSELPRLSEVHLTGASVTFALGSALVVGVLFGLVPLLGDTRDLTMLRESGRGLTPSRSRMNARRALVAAQMAFAVVLLVGASLMVRTFRNLRAVKPGFDVSGVVTMQIALPRGKYGRGGKFYFESATLASNFHEQLVTRVRQLPGVRHVGMSDHVPLISGDWCTGVNVEGPTPEIHRGACPSAALVSPGYFEAMGIKVEGRSLDWNGMHAHDGAMVVSKAFADHHWPNESAVGKGLRFVGLSPPFYRVTGVAADVRGNGVDAPPIEIVYFPMLPIPDAPLWEPATITNLVINSATADPAAVMNTVARVAQELEPQAAVANVQTMETLLAKSMAKQSFTMALLLLSAMIAMLLSAVGIYGVISYLVGQRKGEISVRMALGAQVSEVTLMVLRQGMALSLVGIFAGVLAALATTRLLSTLLFGVTPTDFATLVAVPLSLLAVSLLATYAPARRVARIDPAEALRSE